MFDDTQVLMRMGIAAAKAGDKAQARSYFNRVLNREASPDDRIEVWYWLSEITDDKEEESMYIEQILARDPSEPRARRKWAILKGQLTASEIVNPDKLESEKTDESIAQPVQAKRFTCPNCGGKMVFGSDGKTLVCEYCESKERKKRLTEVVDKHLTQEEHDFILALATSKGHSTPKRMNTFSCKGCGVDFILPPNQLTVICPYCASSYVIEKQESREILTPDMIIPFQINFQQIVNALREWLRKDPPEPPVKVSRGNGAFLPVWVFEPGGTVNWNCQMEISNRWLPRNGKEMILPGEIVVPATARIPKNILPILDDYQIRRGYPYDERYLVNLLAETYSVSVSDASLDARKVILNRETARIEGQFNLPVRDLFVSLGGLAIQSYRLVLIPVWVTYYLSGDERYELWVNGQTGAVFGERPEKGLNRLLDNLFG